MKGIAKMMAGRGLTASLGRGSIFLSLTLIVSLAIGCDAGVIRKLTAALAGQAEGACDKAIASYDRLEGGHSRMRAEEVQLNLIITSLRTTAIGVD